MSATAFQRRRRELAAEAAEAIEVEKAEVETEAAEAAEADIEKPKKGRRKGGEA